MNLVQSISTLRTNMNLYTINYIKTNQLLYNYLRENSYWYKYLNRSQEYLKPLEEEMKKRYKLTTQDRIEKISQGINMVSTILDVLK